MVYCEKKYVAQIIKNARKKQGYTQSQLAEIVEISEKHLSKIETGKNYPALDTFLKISNTLAISLKEFGVLDNAGVTLKRQALQKLTNTLTENQLDAYINILEVMKKYI